MTNFDPDGELYTSGFPTLKNRILSAQRWQTRFSVGSPDRAALEQEEAALHAVDTRRDALFLTPAQVARAIRRYRTAPRNS